MFLGLTIGGLAVILGLFAGGKVEGEPTLFATLFLILAPAAAVWNFRQMTKGVAKLDPEGLVVRARGGGNQAYKWTDISEVRLSTFAERGTLNQLWARFMGIDENEPFVELKLRRSLRLPLLPGRSGTAILGVPSLVAKTVTLYVTEPEEFVRIAQGFVRR